MSKVVACCKWVLDEADIRIADDGSLDTGKAKGKISEYDTNVIAASCEIAESIGAEPVGLTFGTQASKALLKDALSRGLAQAYWVQGASAASADGALTAHCLAEAVKGIDDVSIVVCAEGSSDEFARQTAPRIGALLDIPVVTSVMEVAQSDGRLIAKRRLDDCVESVEVPYPVVLSILPEMIAAPIPGLKAIMAASKKPVTQISADELAGSYGLKATVEETGGCIVERKGIRIDGDGPDECACNLVAALEKEGVL
jgi:electron transfer flavoprotein beta subunit